MSKSLGNFVTVQDLTKRYPKELIRFYLLSTHYRSELEYYEGKLDEMARGWNRLNEAVVNLQSLIGAPSVTCEVSAEDEKVLGRINEIEESIVEALADDFNTAQAIGHLFDLTREINSYSSGSEKISRLVLERAMTVFQEYGINVLGIVREREVQGESLVEPLLDLILEVRQELRMKKEFSLADKLRDRLGELGIVVEDTPHGARWKLEGVNRDAHI